MREGVPITQLHCPTCGLQYELPMRVYEERDPPPLLAYTIMPTEVQIPRAYYIECSRGHRWSIVQITRAANEVDELALGAYLGGGTNG